jgi:hypothetical protein
MLQRRIQGEHREPGELSSTISDIVSYTERRMERRTAQRLLLNDADAQDAA